MPRASLRALVARSELWVRALQIGPLVIAAYLVFDVPMLSLVLLLGLGIFASACCVIGPALRGVAHRTPWTLIGVAILLFLAGIVSRAVAGDLPHVPKGVPDLFTLPGYIVLTAAFWSLLRRHWRANASDHAYLDALMIFVAAASFVVAVFVVPSSESVDAAVWLSVASGLYPLFDVLYLLVIVALSFTTAVRLVSWRLLTLAVGAMLVADLGYAWLATYGIIGSNRLLDVPFMVAMPAAAAAATHPSVRGFDAVRQTPPPPWSGPRVALLVASALLPALGIAFIRPEVAGRVVLAIGFIGVVTALIVRAVNAVGAQAEIQQQLQHRATHDPLTGLGNRALLEQTLSERLTAARGNRTVSLLYVDVDGFKNVNDSFGHGVGDELLSVAAKRLQRVAGTRGLATRVGGDEFAIVTSDDAQGTVGEQLAAAVVSDFAAPLTLSVGRFDATVSVGVANSLTAERRLVTPAVLLREADDAMYDTKTRGEGRGGWSRFDTGHAHNISSRATLGSDLREAVERDELSVSYQPVADLESREMVGMEALVRWHHPRLGRITPSAFLTLAEEHGLLGRITEQVIEKAAHAVATRESTRVSVNIAPAQLHDETFPDRVAAILEGAGLAPDRLDLEVTETAVNSGSSSVTATLARLRELGVGLVLDDFGSGTGALAALGAAPVRMMKLDRAFVTRLDRARVQAVVRGAVALGATYGAVVVAKGVENESQKQRLLECGVEYGQGWLYGRPAQWPVHHDSTRPVPAGVPAARH